MFLLLGEEWGKKRKSGGGGGGKVKRRKKKQHSESDDAPLSSDDSGADKKKRGKPTGFMKELQVSEDLEAIIGIEKATRAEVVKQMWAYIKENKLQVWNLCLGIKLEE